MTEPNSYIMSVLMVDDDNIFHFIMKKMLLRLGVMPEFIQTALNGKEALDRLVEFQLLGVPLPELILLDLNMPMMSGFEFLEAFKKLPLRDGKTKIIIISSSLNDRDSEKAIQLGANRYLTKPVSETDLLQALNKTD